jgi:hypothetical protein
VGEAEEDQHVPPRKSASLRGLPNWSVSAKGPPMLGATSDRKPRQTLTATIVTASSRQTSATPRATAVCGRNWKRGVFSTRVD